MCQVNLKRRSRQEQNDFRLPAQMLANCEQSNARAKRFPLEPVAMTPIVKQTRAKSPEQNDSVGRAQMCHRDQTRAKSPSEAIWRKCGQVNQTQANCQNEAIFR
ncbi:hypothetical protein AVEN_228895-1 [Araneus ventricosus]|uniref:Uncharacterized protein n=1 Tax=Araneus ventricosus TaxID=182803 RepID=A0A4Y2MDA8_ARAVE|nr:hypothetical protein AVEN_228895-1 [Araneus ventricosus]